MLSKERLRINKKEVLDHHGLSYNSIKDTSQGSWNTFDVFQCTNESSKILAMRRLREDILKSRFQSKKYTPEELQKRFDEELEITECMALFGLAPRLQEVLYEIHSEFLVKKNNAEEPLKSYIYIPDVFDGSLHSFVFKNPLDLIRPGKTLKSSAHEIGSALVDLCLQMKELDYCNLDIKLGNIVVRIDPWDIRFIDFDPGYMRSRQKDEEILEMIRENFLLNQQDSVSYLRIFYGVIMILFLALECHKYVTKPTQSTQKSLLLEFIRSFRKRLRQIPVTCIPLFDVISKEKNELIEKIIERCLHYNFLEKKLNQIKDVKKAFNSLTKAQQESPCDQKHVNKAKQFLKEARKPYIIPALRETLTSFTTSENDASLVQALSSSQNHALNPRQLDLTSWHKYSKKFKKKLA